ncbi:MAG: hypothetical protein HY208_02545 [Nitrospirae bacterium]|nr:hypothetical protein [Nitrospirota bacterium]
MIRAAVAFVVGIALGCLVWDASTAWAAPVQAPPAAKSEPEEAPHRVMLLGATVYGAVSAPNAIYDVPWQEPFLLGKGAGELDRNFLKEIFKPVDREEFLKQSAP